MSQTPSSPAPHADDQGFDPLEFWLRYKGHIRAGSALLLAAMAAYAVSEWISNQRENAAAEAFAVAKTPEQLATFVSEHRGIPAAGNAAMLLAGKQRAAGQLDEALKTLRDFVAQSPAHPMAGAAQLATASILEQQGKQDDALAAYRRLISIDPRGMATPAAYLRIARISKGQNKIEDAKSAYESLQSQFPNSSFANEAMQEAQQLSALTPASANTPETGEVPAPAAPSETKPVEKNP